MKLGILVNTDKHLGHILGLAAAATAKGHEVIIFAMDQGVRLLENGSFTELAGRPGVSVSICDHSAKTHGIATEGISDAVAISGQFENAMMANKADKLIVL
ncbi:MAG: DsrE family protein [Rhodospirillales bacterium]